MTALIAFSLKRSNIMVMDDESEDPLAGAADPVIAPDSDEPKKDELLDETLPVHALRATAPCRAVLEDWVALRGDRERVTTTELKSKLFRTKTNIAALAIPTHIDTGTGRAWR